MKSFVGMRGKHSFLLLLFTFLLAISAGDASRNGRRQDALVQENRDPADLQARLILSNDFEDGLLGAWYDDSGNVIYWGIESHATPSEVNSPAPSPATGTKYVRVIRNAALNSGSAFFKSQPFTALPGDMVGFKFWIRSYRPEANNLELLMVIGRNETLLLRLSEFSAINNYEWRTVESIKIPVDTPTTIQLMFYGYCGSYDEDAIAIDEIVVVNSDGGNTPTTTATTTTPTTTTAPTTTAPTTTPTTTRTTTTATTTTIRTTTIFSGCGGEFVGGTSGSFTSPGYPGLYQNGLYCPYSIQVATNNRIHLNFSSFATETGFDFVTVYDGISTSNTVLLKHSGGTIPGPVTSSSYQLLVLFTTDGSNVSQGFSAMYTAF